MFLFCLNLNMFWNYCDIVALGITNTHPSISLSVLINTFTSFTAKDESHCVLCNEPGDMLKQLFCTSCGQHYHSDCLEEEIECNTVVRAGWQCPECKVCQGCRKPGDDHKMLVCDVCDKGYHTFCLSPAIKSIPPNGWRCSVRLALISYA